ncbi:hypothetical protein [Spongiactinospora sp. TRM90649]|uniref:hypothetical protein n=1 Tax=Spongiactinospora sp. TRM90649 TaxID=3031114 RepID=UPI0023F879F8|nr:hypothetical protein [Spongiactinospora sp. TRM90649]MDF5758179.1 hypothetical protein [Spongiactinospora sp. TRM90649]
MSALTSLPAPDPDPDDVARGLADLERHLAGQAPPVPPSAVKPTPSAAESKRVRRLRAEVAEAHALADLLGDDTPLVLDSVKVRKRRKAAQQAARLHTLARDPQMRAFQAARMRRVLVSAALTSLTLALAWSTAGVQRFASEGASVWSPGWLFAWLVEPFLSLALLVVVGARAYMGTRGQPIRNKTLARIEGLFLALTLGMNAWPYLPWSIPDGAAFSLSALVLHLLGPVVAVAIVTALPIILAAFAALDHDEHDDAGASDATSGTPTAAAYRHNATATEALTARARHLIATGELPADAGADKIRRALGCGMDSARAVRDALRAQAV